MFGSRTLGPTPDAIAPDGLEVRLLLATERGSMAHFSLSPMTIGKAVAHRTVDEIWYFVAGRGQMWLSMGEEESVIPVEPGTCVSIPLDTRFQVRNDGDADLSAVAVTMPPWPGEGEATVVDGRWDATVGDAARA